jgi:hypothetical protein
MHHENAKSVPLQRRIRPFAWIGPEFSRAGRNPAIGSVQVRAGFACMARPFPANTCI